MSKEPIEFWFAEEVCSCGVSEFTHKHECYCCSRLLSHDSDFFREYGEAMEWCREQVSDWVEGDFGVRVDGALVVFAGQDGGEFRYRVRKIVL